MKGQQMTPSHFSATLLDGHKGAAAEVPFDPAVKWSIPATALWKGRRGHRVRAELNGTAFESAIVPRSKRYYLLLSDEQLTEAGASIGDTVKFAVEPA
jgi:hypothetical protein